IAMIQFPIRHPSQLNANPTIGPARMTIYTNKFAAEESGTSAPAWAAPWTNEIARCDRTATVSQRLPDLRVASMLMRRAGRAKRDNALTNEWRGLTYSHMGMYRSGRAPRL